MQRRIINLKQRIDKNYKKLQRKYPLTKIILYKLENLIQVNTTDENIELWLKEYDNVIFILEYNLNKLEQVSA